MNEPILRVDNVHYAYVRDSHEPIHALNGASFAVMPGEYVAIIGRNGSGKSTLAKHLNGLLLPTQGDVWVKGWNTKDARRQLDVRSTVGMVFQSPDNQIVATIVEEDVAFGPENLGVPRAELRARVDRALDTVGMQAYRHRAPHLLSGGQKQRVAIAGILAIQPSVLVLDESTALLDPVGREEVLRIAQRLNDEGVTIIAITHLMAEAARARRVVVMDQGRVALDGAPREVFGDADRLRELQLDVPEITQLAERVHSRLPSFPQDLLTVEDLVAAVKRLARECPKLVPADRKPVEPPADRPVVIDVRRLERTYLRGTPLESVALRGVDLTVRHGEVVGLIGHTGSGKSTLIQHLNGLLRPQRGQVIVLDRDLGQSTDLRALRRQVGLVFQFPEAQLFERYVGDDVAFGPWQMGIRGEDLRTRVADAMTVVGLDFSQFKDRPLYSLSGGEKRRAALAGVLAIRPKILVLDEPTAGLDPRGHQDVLARLMAFARERDMTLVVVSHNMEDIARVCDRVYVLAEGETAADGTAREVFGRADALRRWGLGVPAITAAMQALAAVGLPVRTDVITLDEAECELAQVIDGRN